MTPRWLSCQWFCLSVSSRLLIAPLSCISIQGFCLSVSSGNLITPPSCLSLQGYSLFVSSRFLIAPPCCLLLQGYCLSVSLSPCCLSTSAFSFQYYVLSLRRCYLYVSSATLCHFWVSTTITHNSPRFTPQSLVFTGKGPYKLNSDLDSSDRPVLLRQTCCRPVHCTWEGLRRSKWAPKSLKSARVQNVSQTSALSQGDPRR